MAQRLLLKFNPKTPVRHAFGSTVREEHNLQLKLFRTLWGASGGYHRVAEEARSAGFDGLEGQVPDEKAGRRELASALATHGFFFIAEITTAGGYVPDRRATVKQHLDDLASGLVKAKEMNAIKVNCIAGCDAWEIQQQEDFFGLALEMIRQYKIPVAFETHRSRSLFNPWVTRDLVRRFDELKLTCDFSHWCVVCERLLDSEQEVLDQVTPRAIHIHARVGYDQGPQVPHPAAPEYQPHMDAHQRWWQQIWNEHDRRGSDFITMTPEFGPDGYLHLQPFTKLPVADLWQINQWIATRQRDCFDSWKRSNETLSQASEHISLRTAGNES